MFIHRDDDAWDFQRIEAAKDDPRTEYYSGKTRFRLGDLAGFLKQNSKPTRFYLRDLPEREYQHVQGLLSLASNADEAGAELWMREAASHAFRHGLEDADGVDVVHHSDGELTEETMLAIRRLKPDLPQSLGWAAIVAGNPVTVEEGKA